MPDRRPSDRQQPPRREQEECKVSRAFVVVYNCKAILGRNQPPHTYFYELLIICTWPFERIAANYGFHLTHSSRVYCCDAKHPNRVSPQRRLIPSWSRCEIDKGCELLIKAQLLTIWHNITHAFSYSYSSSSSLPTVNCLLFTRPASRGEFI